MSDMKCPICNKPMQISYPSASGYHYCYNCGISSGGIAYKALERTRKALEIAVRAIETIKYSKKSDAINLRHKANKALIEIYKIKDQTALEQKD